MQSATTAAMGVVFQARSRMRLFEMGLGRGLQVCRLPPLGVSATVAAISIAILSAEADTASCNPLDARGDLRPGPHTASEPRIAQTNPPRFGPAADPLGPPTRRFRSTESVRSPPRRFAR